MTLVLTPAMDAARLRTEKIPSYNVMFDGCPYNFGAGAFQGSTPLLFGAVNEDTGVSFKFGDNNPDTGDPLVFGDSVAFTANNVDTLLAPSGFGANVVPSQGQSSVSGGTIPVLHSEEFHELVTTYGPLRGKKVWVRAGFQGVPSSEWVVVFTGRVKDLNPSDDGTTWIVEVGDLQRDLSRDVFRCLSTELFADVTIDETTEIKVVSGEASGVFPASGHIRIGEEVIKYDAVTATPGAPGCDSFTTLTRAQCGTVAAVHRLKDKVGEFLVLHGNPVELALQIMTSTGEGTNGAYDVLPERHGLGIDQNDIDIVQSGTDPYAYEAVRDSLRTDYSLDDFEFWIGKPRNAKSFLEEEIFKTCGLYQIIRGDGRFALKLFTPPTPESVAPVLDDSNVKSCVISGQFERQYNQLVWSLDEKIDGTFATILTENQTASQARYGATWSFPIESRGLRTYLSDNSTAGNGRAIAIARSGRMMTRYAEPPIVATVEGFFEAFHIEQGDLVTLRCSSALNPRTGSRGITAGYLMEVASRTPNYANGTMTFELHYTPFAGTRYARRAPVWLSDYDAASDEEKSEYTFIGSGYATPAGTTVGASNDQPYFRS